MTNFNPDEIPNLETAELRNHFNALGERAATLSSDELRLGVRIMIELRNRARATPRGRAASEPVRALSIDEL